MAGKAERRKKGRTRPAFRSPWSLVALILMALAIFLLAALWAYRPGLSGPLGLAGDWASRLFLLHFGRLSFWPIPAIGGMGWLVFKRVTLSFSLGLKIAGWVLFLFTALALASMPAVFNHPEGFSAAGGLFGNFLAEGASKLAGNLGAWLSLPLLALAGLILALPPLGRFLSAALGRLWLTLRTIFVSASGLTVPEPVVPDLVTAFSLPQLSVPPPLIIEKLPAASVELPNPVSPQLAIGTGGVYILPPLDFLDLPLPASVGHASGLSHDDLMGNARLLETKLRDFGVEGRVLEVSGGPVITMYEYQPAPGVKIAKVVGLADDLALAMSALSIRVVGQLPGKPAIGIEVPNPRRSLVAFREVVESPIFQKARSPLSLVLGVDIMGAPVVADLARMPHILIAGATGAGKSVGLNAMIMSILYKAPPEQVRFLMIDPKSVEFTMYKDIPHLIYPVLSEPAEATLALKWAVAEMDSRYRLLAEKEVRNIETYNEKIRAELKNNPLASGEGKPRELPFLVIIIDELADLLMVSAKEVEVYITRLAQKARAAGIHLILATQRPTVDVLTGIIKANLPTRIAFQVTSKIDSRTILDQIGAEKLLGKGDMLFLPPGVNKLRRLHGANVTDAEIKKVTDFVRAWGPPEYLEDLSLPESEGGGGENSEKDEKYAEAVELVRRTQKATISHVQRHLRIGYNRAARIIEDMEREGIIGPPDGIKPRLIL
ncbi:MAG: hypothetical protein AMR96_05500 [Candidatus Adiutrix intracellularis]|nr:MAG: hypothetical protein AMR96_05500 [Candidatus Adiutrix intracellularis]